MISELLVDDPHPKSLSLRVRDLKAKQCFSPLALRERDLG
jgi:hypothetical protein